MQDAEVNKNELAGNSKVGGYGILKNIKCLKKLQWNSNFSKEGYGVIKAVCISGIRWIGGRWLVKYNDDCVVLTEKGRYFMRNVCAAFDMKLHRDNHQKEMVFSKAI